MELLGEEVNPKISVLASLSGSGNANDLTGTTLKDQKITNADVMTGDSNRIRPSSTLYITNTLAYTITNSGWATFIINDYFLTLSMMMMMMRMMGVEWVENAVRCFFHTMAEGVVLTLVVVVAHLGSGTGWWINGCFGFNFNLFSRSGGVAFSFELYFFVRFCVMTLVFNVVCWLGPTSVVPFGDVDFFTMRNLDVNLSVGITLNWLTITMRRSLLDKINMNVSKHSGRIGL